VLPCNTLQPDRHCAKATMRLESRVLGFQVDDTRVDARQGRFASDPWNDDLFARFTTTFRPPPLVPFPGWEGAQKKRSEAQDDASPMRAYPISHSSISPPHFHQSSNTVLIIQVLGDICDDASNKLGLPRI